MITNDAVKIVIFILILAGVLLNTLAQLLLKAGMTQIGHFDFSFANVVPIGLKVMLNVPILGGLCAYVVSVGVWLWSQSTRTQSPLNTYLYNLNRNISIVCEN